MFSAIFQHHVGYLAICTLIGLILGGASWTLVCKRGNPHGAWWSGLAFTLTGVLGVTFMGGGSASGVCVLNHQLAEPFHTTQGLWNLAMMVPVGAFALLAIRRPLPVLVGVIALPLAIEFTQATVNGLGRVCDSSDAQMNIIGGLIGLTVVAVVLAIRHSLAWQAGTKGALVTFAALLLLSLGVARPILDFTNVDGSSLAGASADQRRVVEAAVKEAFGDRYKIGQQYAQPCVGASCTNIIFNLHSREEGHSKDFGTGSLSWPDKKHLNVLLENSDRPTIMGYSVGGTKAPSTSTAASRIAKSYAQRKYPWAMGATMSETSAVGAKAELGWITSWRWTHNDVLMPRMLDVQVDRAGHVSQIDVTLGPTRVKLPEAKLDAVQAEKEVDKAVAVQLQANGNTGAEFHTKAFTVKAVERDGNWRPNWLVNVTWPSDGQSDDPQEQAPVDTYRVDALTGQVYDAAGQTLTLWGTQFPAPADDAESVDCPLRFPGQYADAESGLNQNFHRYYDPETAAYLSPDPLGLEAGPNLYWYGPHPLTWTDPYGLALCRTTPRLENGNPKEGWQHIDERHISGTAQGGHGDLMPPSTTRGQVEKAVRTMIERGQRVSDPGRRIQTFEKRMTVNGMSARYRLIVDSEDGNRVITFFPVGKSYTP